MSNRNKFLVIFLIFLVFFSILYCSLKIATLPVEKKNVFEVTLEVPTGTSAKDIAFDLKAKKLIRAESVFYAVVRFPVLRFLLLGEKINFSLKSGVYKIKSDMDLKEILKVLSSGKQEFLRVSIPEGWTISKIAHRLENEGVCVAEEFRNACFDKNLLEKYGIVGENFEGYLFPDTYFFTPLMPAENVVVLMVDNFFSRIKSIPNLAELSMSDLSEVVILASIVEREYRLDEEAPLIASVFKNRIAHNIGLYSCATIEYIITEIEGKEHPDVITYEDLSVDSPYNTYKWAGLPPGAISNPGLVALDAAFNPEKTNYYYFRLVDATSGRHVFTKDFSTHISEGYIYNTKK